MADPSDHELAHISYIEVLDATKHQDDKIGRLLAAVAFLTGGALVFTARDILQATYVVGGHEYRLTALFLGAFLVLDLVAVILWILTMTTPLTSPGTSRSDQSFLFFHLIAKTPEDEWKGKWATEGLVERHTNDLIVEAHNLARRAEGKYVRSGLATRIFLASVIVLVPTVILSVDSVSQPVQAPSTAGVLDHTSHARSHPTPSPQAGDTTMPIPWTMARRSLAALPVAVVVLSLGLWRCWAPAPKRRSSAAAMDEHTPRLARDLRTLACVQPLFVFFAIVGNGASLAWTLAVLAAGAAATSVLIDIARKNVAEQGHWILWLTVALATGLTVGGTITIALGRPELQLVVGMAAACLVPFESTPPPSDPSGIATGARSGQ